MVDLDTSLVQNFNDPAFRKALRADPKATLQQEIQGSGLRLDDEMEFVVVTNTEDIYYIAMPHYSQNLDDKLLSILSAGDGAGAVSSAGSLGTASSAFTCLFSVSSVGCVSSVKV